MQTEWIILTCMALVAFAIVRKTIRDNFQPYSQSRIMLIVAGVLIGIVAAFFVLPVSFWNKVLIGVFIGLFLGGGMVYTLPRQWRIIQSRIPKQPNTDK